MAQYVYCPKCNRDVEAIEVSMGTRGGESVIRCSECGTVLAQKESDLKGKSRSTPEMLVAGYSPAHADILIATFVRRGFAQEIQSCLNGDEFLAKMTKYLHLKQPPKLIVLDVNMPIMNGINAALCLRSIEKAVSREKVPLLFFTQRELDDQFVRAIKFLTPAKYMPQPPNADIDVFRDRASQIVDLLKKEAW